MIPRLVESSDTEAIPIAVWARGSEFPALPEVPGLKVGRLCSGPDLALISGSFETIVAARKAAGQRPYVARLDGDMVAYAWVATGLAHIGEMGVSFQVPAEDRYLCELIPIDGRAVDVMPQILQAIVKREDACLFWAAARRHKGPSMADLERAGFEVAGTLTFSADAGTQFQPTSSRETLTAACKALGLPARERARGKRTRDTATAQGAPSRNGKLVA